MSDRPPELDKLLDYVAGTITPEQEAFGIMATALIEAGDSSAAKAALIVKGIAEELKLRDAEILRLRASRNEVRGILMDKMDAKIATFARAWFAAFTGDEDHYDIERLDGKNQNTHATLDQFVDELCELIIDAEIAAKEAS